MSNPTTAYRPNASLLAIGEKIEAADFGKSLMRFPGPCGLFEIAHSRMDYLAPESSHFLFMSKIHYDEFHRGIETFGVLTVFDAEQFHPVKLNDPQVLTDLGFSAVTPNSIFLGLNLKVTPANYFWMPPEMYAAPQTWNDRHRADDLKKVFGTGYDTRVTELKNHVMQYMEEVQVLESHQITLPQPWYKITAEDRRKTLGDKKIQSRWTR